MTENDLRALLAAWALDAVDADERAAVEAAIAADPALAAEAAGFRAVADVLGTARSIAPPADLRERVLAEVAQTVQQSPSPTAADHGVRADPTTPQGPTGDARTSTHPGTVLPFTRPARRSPIRALLVAAVLVLALALPSALAWQQHRRATEAEARADRITALLASPGATLLTGDLSSGGTASAVVTADAALLSVEGATDPGDGQVYQLWVMRDGVPVPDATSGVRDGAFQIDTTQYRSGDGLALTVEPDGGSQTPSSDPVVVLLPTA
ncbi:anti-sigma factor [Cellulomonas sp. NPDC089187]|uniref:anti-sigma factor n=1 Tax=Cellulomonas sp. NPDC089187 TaxID=3154970 RepID=UPI003417EAEB